MSEELLTKIRVALWEANIQSSDDAIDVIERIYNELKGLSEKGDC